MKFKSPFWIVLILVLLVSYCSAQDKSLEPTVKVEKLKQNLYEIKCGATWESNTILSVGPDGMLLVDTGFWLTADPLADALIGLGGKPNVIIATHHHPDHIGGIKKLCENAQIIAHQNASNRIAGKYYSLPPIKGSQKADVEVTDSLTVYFNGETIKLLHIPGGHTDGDMLVHFEEANVVVLGDLLFTEQLPYIELFSGGNAMRYIDNLKMIEDRFTDDAIFVPGHGRVCNKEELHQNILNLRQMVELIKTEIATGKSVEQMMGDNLLFPWESWTTGTVKAEDWIANVMNSLSGNVPPSICEALTCTLQNDGIDDAVRQYRKLKNNSSDLYDFNERELNVLGYQLMKRSRIADARAIFKLNVEAYPDSWNVYDSYAEACLAQNDTNAAIFNYEQSLKLNPDNGNAREILKNINSGME